MIGSEGAEQVGPAVVNVSVVEKAQRAGEFRDSIPAEFAVMAFYGAIEQVLTGWIFGLLEQGDEAYDRAKAHIVDTICRGLAA